jgi:hypothetical protein
VLTTQIGYNLTYGKGKRLYDYPRWATDIGWLISCIPLSLLPLMVFYNLWKFQNKNQVLLASHCDYRYQNQKLPLSSVGVSFSVCSQNGLRTTEFCTKPPVEIVYYQWKREERCQLWPKPGQMMIDNAQPLRRMARNRWNLIVNKALFLYIFNTVLSYNLVIFIFK